jgi:membrane protease subunit (stomatin/prohibitin family)
MNSTLVYVTSTEQVQRQQANRQAMAAVATATARPAKSAPAYGACLNCGCIEVRLVTVIGYRDLSDMGESSTYPVGDTCEMCS